MPTLDFTPDNTAPVAAAVGLTPDNTAPDSKPDAAFTPDNTPPGAAAVGLTPDDTLPVSKPDAAFTPDNTAPDAAAVTAGPDNAAPVGKAADAAAPDDAAPVSKPDAVFTPDNTAPDAAAVTAGPDDAAPVGKAAVTSEPDGAAPGTLSAPTNNGTNEPPLPMPQATLPAETDDTVNTPVINIPGDLVLNRIYGQTRVAANCALHRIQIQLNDAPQGADAKIQIVDGNGDPVSAEITIPDGQTFAELVPGVPIALLAGANLRAKCTQVGAGGNPGGFGVATLFFQLAA
jgi:hypothetical protein